MSTFIQYMGQFDPNALGAEIGRLLAPPYKGTVATAVVKVVKDTLERNMIDTISPVLKEAYETHVMLFGEHPGGGGDAAADWESAMDDAVDDALAPYAQVLSQDWLGRSTIGTTFHVDINSIGTFANSFANEVFKQTTYKMTPEEIQEAFGASDEWCRSFIPEGGADATRSANLSDVTEAFDALITQIDESMDEETFFDELDLATDEDEVLAQAAMTRLCPASDATAIAFYTNALRAYRVAHPEGIAGLTSAFSTRAEGGEITADEKVTDNSKKSKGKKSSSKKEAAPVSIENALDPRVLQLLKENGSTTDKQLGEAMGISRAAMNNAVNGKKPFTPDDQQREHLRSVIWGHASALVEAMALLDGQHYDIVVAG